jgi:two-component system invasion response regulator UvrY
MDGSARGKLRILILDDHAVVRRGVRQILAESLDLLEFSEGKAGQEGLDLALDQSWELVIVAIDLPDREGLKVLAEFMRMRPDQPVLVLTIRVKLADGVGIVKPGTTGQVEVANNPDELLSAVRRVLSGGAISRELASHKSLSNRELEVLRLIGLGRTVKEVAAALALSEKPSVLTGAAY